MFIKKYSKESLFLHLFNGDNVGVVYFVLFERARAILLYLIEIEPKFLDPVIDIAVDIPTVNKVLAHKANDWC